MQMLHDVPSIYQKVEWIGAERNQLPYIDMDFYLTDELETEIHFYNDKEEAFLFGVRKGMSTVPYCNFNISKSPPAFRFDYGSNRGDINSFSDMHDGEFLFTFHNRIATITNLNTQVVKTVEYSTTGHVFSAYTDQTLPLFRIRTGATLSNGSMPNRLRIYSAKFWIGGVLIRDFVPCVRKADNEPGMYDKVTKRFFTKGDPNTFTVPT